jgi:phage shock protein PspC (stress-responsive transcriptional regulator)
MRCPYCRNEIPDGALRCSACTSWLPERPPVRQWHRAREGRMLGGVCRGLANHYGLPVAAVRLATILATFLGFWGLPVYVLLWILMPLEPLPAPAPATPAHAAVP